jgi:hypothetical protein
MTTKTQDKWFVVQDVTRTHSSHGAMVRAIVNGVEKNIATVEFGTLEGTKEEWDRAELIVRAVNCHEALKKTAADVLWLGNNLHNIRQDPDRFREFYETMLKSAREAIAKAEPSGDLC